MSAVHNAQDPLVNLHQDPLAPHAPTFPTGTSNTASTNTGADTNNAASLQSIKDSVLSTGASVVDTISNHPATQQAKDTIVNGPVGQSVQSEANKTSSEFSNLANARKTPAEPAATGQPLTHYHSLFYRLLSWKDPRATGIVFATLVSLIFASRYLDVLRYSFKVLYSVLGVTVLAELAGKAALGDGFATKVRPKKYYTIRKESLERFLDDVEQLINFVVIEFQRVIFAENIWATVAAFSSSFVSYWLIKWLPLWGLTLLATLTTFLTPLVYFGNKQFIDGQLNHANKVINEQATQVRGLAAQHTSQASDTLRSYAGEYSQKAQELIGSARGKTNGATSPSTQFPNAPKHEPATSTGPTPATIPSQAPLKTSSEPVPAQF